MDERDADCLFCRIAAGEISAGILHEDESGIAFRDVDPQAPTHVLVIPRRHVPSVDALADADWELLAALFAMVRSVAGAEGLEDGYRVVTNVGRDGGQSVGHLHLHVLGGRSLGWPPG